MILFLALLLPTLKVESIIVALDLLLVISHVLLLCSLSAFHNANAQMNEDSASPLFYAHGTTN